MGWNAHVELPGVWKCPVGMVPPAAFECPGTARSHHGGGSDGVAPTAARDTGHPPGHNLAVQGQQEAPGCCCCPGSPSCVPRDERCWTRCRGCPLPAWLSLQPCHCPCMSHRVLTTPWMFCPTLAHLGTPSQPGAAALLCLALSGKSSR